MNHKQSIEDHKEAFGEEANVQTYGCLRIMDLAVVWVTLNRKAKNWDGPLFLSLF